MKYILECRFFYKLGWIFERMKWPLSSVGEQVLGNPESNNAICTLWTERHEISDMVSPELFNVVGQCYSRIEGVSEIVRNVLARKEIRRIFIYGNDRFSSGDTLISLGRGDDVILRDDLPKDAIQRFRENVEMIDMRQEYKNKQHLKSLEDRLKSYDAVGPWGENEYHERLAPAPPRIFPSEKSGMVVRGGKVGDAWLNIIDNVMRFGTQKPSQYDDDQIELPNLVTVITNEDVNDIYWHPAFAYFPEKNKDDLDRGLTIESLIDYLPQLLTANTMDGVNYTYGALLRDHRGVDQIQLMKDELKKDFFSRRAVGITWDVEKVSENNIHAPCLDLVQALLQDDNRLYFSAVFRSNDMFKAWPKNAMALRHVQKEIADYLNADVGDMIVSSNSAHIYSADWDAARELLDQYPAHRRSRMTDPRGNILIYTEGDKILIQHQSPDGVALREFYAANARHAYTLIKRNKMISDMGHALDIGVELGKAESAIRTGEKYVQDKPLKYVRRRYGRE